VNNATATAGPDRGPPPSTRLFIADPGLEDSVGHHLSYTSAVAEAARDRGMEVVVFANRRFRGALEDPSIMASRVFDTRYRKPRETSSRARQIVFGAASYLPGDLARRVAPAIQTVRRRLQSGAALDSLGAELSAALAEYRPGATDWVLLHTVSGANLASLAAGPDLGEARLSIVLRQMPHELEADDPAPVPTPVLFQQLWARFGPRVSLSADTEELAARYTTLAGQPVRPIPLPPRVPPPIDRPIPARPHVVFAGSARTEKGYHHLPAAIAAAADRARFTIHSGAIDAYADPSIQRAHRALRALGREAPRLIERPLDIREYEALLASADLLLLPYDAVRYGVRSSGILAEGLALGIPAIVPAGGWMERVAAPDRAVAIGLGGVTEALVRALDGLPDMTVAARAASGAWRARHNPGAMLTALLASD
jgi:glycosyltransferase involved in cell wall biosynthesis